MTLKTKALLAQIEEELSALPEDEQEAYLDELLQALRRRKRGQNEEEAPTHPFLDILQQSQIEDLPPDYPEQLDHYLYGTGDE